jgi:hypothetical protein
VSAIPVEELREIQRKENEPAPVNKQSTPGLEFVPVPIGTPPPTSGGSPSGVAPVPAGSVPNPA